MGAVIEVGVASETKAFKQGVEAGIIKPLDDAADKLDDLAKTHGPEKLERELEAAQKATKDLGRQVERTAEDIERDFRASYRSAERSADDFHEGAGEGVQAFKEEAIQNFSEVASSFDGDLSAMADGVQGLTGGLAASLTPGVGIPIAILGAAASAFLASWAESTEESKKRVSDMYQDMIASGQAFLSEDFISKALADIIDDDGKRQKAIDDAKRLGVETATALRAQAGDQAAINELAARAAELKQAEAEAVKASGEPLDQQAIKLDAINTKYAEILDTYTGITSETQQAIDKVNLYRDAVGEAASADQKRYEALGRAMASAPKSLPLDIDTSSAERKLNGFINQKRAVEVKLRATDRYGREI